jgi:hypothetical protein
MVSLAAAPASAGQMEFDAILVRHDPYRELE